MARRKYRSRRRRRPRRRRRARVQKSLFGNSRVVKHKYCYAGQQTVVNPANLAQVETFRLLSPADPDVSEAGTQFKAQGFDEMHTMFQNCQVLGAKARITWLPTASHGQIYWANISKDNQFGQGSNVLQGILNMRNTVYKYSMLNPGSTMGTTITRRHSPKKFNQFKDYKDATDYQCIPATELVASGSLTPFENYINFGFSTTHPGFGGLTTTCDFTIVIDYIIRWFGPINPAASLA